MKNVVLASLLAVISVLGMENAVLSQNSIGMIRERLSASKLLLPRVAFENAPVNSKALNSFKKKFTAVQNEKWYHNKHRSVAVFEADEVRFSIEYDKKGNLTGTEKLYGEGKMDREVRKIVKSVYFDYTITSVREISVPWLFPSPVYIIHIENENEFKNLTVYEDEMKIVDELSKN